MPTATTHETSIALALAVIRERVDTLRDDDRSALLRLLPVIFGKDEEERQSAIRAVTEILNPPSGRIMELPEGESRDWMKAIGDKIREARENAGMTQEELAEATGIQQSHISRLEQGEHSPTAKTRQKIAAAIGVEASMFE